MDSPSIVTDLSPTSVVEPQGRLALASFPNNIVNVNPADYMLLKLYAVSQGVGACRSTTASGLLDRW